MSVFVRGCEGVISEMTDCNFHCCCTVWWQWVQRSAWSVQFCTRVRWCRSIAARCGEGERGFPRWLWFCPSSSSQPLSPDCPVPFQRWSGPSSPALFSLSSSAVLMPPHTNTPQLRRVHWPPQTGRRSSGASVSLWDQSSGYKICTCMRTLSPLPPPGWWLGQGDVDLQVAAVATCDKSFLSVLCSPPPCHHRQHNNMFIAYNYVPSVMGYTMEAHFCQLKKKDET